MHDISRNILQSNPYIVIIKPLRLLFSLSAVYICGCTRVDSARNTSELASLSIIEIVGARTCDFQNYIVESLPL